MTPTTPLQASFTGTPSPSTTASPPPNKNFIIHFLKCLLSLFQLNIKFKMLVQISPTDIQSESPILRKSDSQKVRFSESQILRFSESQILTFSESEILAFSESQILRFSESQILRSDIWNCCCCCRNKAS